MKMNTITKGTNTADEIQNSNLGSVSQLTKSIEWLSLDTNVNDQIPLTQNSDKLPKPSQYVELQYRMKMIGINVK